MKKKVIASYLENFDCVGGICEDNCCIGWNVEIDKKTYGKYKKVKDKELAGLFEKYIYKNDESYDENVDFAVVELKDNKYCPFLKQDKLCAIQVKLGESYLSNVCSSYPRMINEIDGVLEYSATVSCPEIARLALGATDGIQFDPTETKDGIQFDRTETKDGIKFDRIATKGDKNANGPKDDIISIIVNTKDGENQLLIEYLQELRGLSIDILQSRKYRLWQRILILGIFFQKVQEIQNRNKAGEIPELILQFSNKWLHQEFENGLEKVPGKWVEKVSIKCVEKQLETYPVNQEIQLKILKEIADKFNDLNEIDSKKYISFIHEFNRGIRENTYSSLFEDIYEPFMENNEVIIENYLVNYVFQSLFPAGESSEPFEAYQHLVIRYGLIKLYLMGIGGFRRELTETLVIEFIQSFSKGLEHNYNYFEQVNKYMKENDYNTLSTMSLLIRN